MEKTPMGIGTVARLNAIALATRRVTAVSSRRLLRFTFGWAIMLGGTCILASEVGAAAPLVFHRVFDAIKSVVA